MDMPLFQGNAKSNEYKFKHEIDENTFLRSVEIYFDQQGITSDEKKMQIFFSLIDKRRGDAIRLITCYAAFLKGKFEAFKLEFLAMYLFFILDGFKNATQALLSTKLTPEEIICAMTTLENASLVVAVANLKSEILTNGKFNEKTTIELIADMDAALVIINTYNTE